MREFTFSVNFTSLLNAQHIFMNSRLNNIVNWYFSRKAAPYWMVLLLDTLIVLFSELASYYIVYNGVNETERFGTVFVTFLLFLPGFFIGFRLFRTYSGIIRYSNSTEIVRLVGAMGTGSIIGYGIHYFLKYYPDSIYNIKATTLIIGFLLAIVLSVSVRMVVKYLYDHLIYAQSQQRCFVYGIHEGGEALGHSILNDKESPYVLSGFVCDEPKMCRHTMMGVKVYMNDENLITTMRKNHIRVLFVSPMRNDALRENPEFLNKLVKNGIKVMMQPSEEEWDGHSELGARQLHEVEIEDLLPRDKIEVDLKKIGELLADKVVMVTGSAGSIGYEMVRQVAKFKPRHMVLVDQAETPMHTVRLHMANHYPELQCETVVSSIANKGKMESLFKKYRPDYVFHAAAYKHVPMMEDNPSEAVQNNIYGTRVIADLAVRYGTKKFVMISTDKAVNPTNVMGCSKRICEIYCQALNKAIQDGTCPIKLEDEVASSTGKQEPFTQFVTTRFGNVLGSNGSVIPIFKKQIKAGGPVTVTHPDIIRFFMLIPEACRLVLEAGTMGNGGEIFVFDMGKPVRIADLAQRMIDLSGAKGVEIKYTGLRDGEKLYEEVLNDQEHTKPTPHPKIMVSAVREYPFDLALKNEEELYQLSLTYDDMAIVKKMKEIVPEYKSKQSKYEVLDAETA